MSNDERNVSFGFQKVEADQKPTLVDGVFASVAQRYDLMNDLMSLGIHRLWKRHFAATTPIRRSGRIIDLAGGTGDIAALLAKRMGDSGTIYIVDRSLPMLAEGKNRALDEGFWKQVRLIGASAEALPVPDNSIDVVTCAFGLRNFTDIDGALREVLRVLRAGGRLRVLEFSRVRPAALRPLYDVYSFAVLPAIGKAVANDADSYRYLAESIREHPNQEALASRFEQAGFEKVSVRNLSAGIVAIHEGIKL